MFTYTWPLSAIRMMQCMCDLTKWLWFNCTSGRFWHFCSRPLRWFQNWPFLDDPLRALMRPHLPVCGWRGCLRSGQHICNAMLSKRSTMQSEVPALHPIWIHVWSKSTCFSCMKPRVHIKCWDQPDFENALKWRHINGWGCNTVQMLQPQFQLEQSCVFGQPNFGIEVQSICMALELYRFAIPQGLARG